MALKTNEDMEKRFDEFTDKLSQLSTEYGITLDVCGGVWISPEKENVQKITYSKDPTSGDLSSYVTYSDGTKG